MTGQHLNGSGKPNGDGKIASLDDARKRAAARAKDARRQERAQARGYMSPRDWLVGGIVIAMALGMIWFWVAPLVRATGVTR